MREILFKAKRVDNNEWVEGFYVFTSNKYHQILTGKWSNETGSHYSFEVHPETVCQFTGVLDKKGNKIFHGDICSSKYFNTPLSFSKEKPSYTTVEQVVIFSIGSFLLQNTVLHNDFEKDIRNHTDLHYIKSTLEIEVIGNIHD